MRLVKQRHASDCGVACVAMLADVSWEEANLTIFGRVKERGFYTQTADLRDALRRLGVILEIRMKVCRAPRRLRRDALLKTNTRKGGYWHWAVWDAERQEILDPYGYKAIRPVSCIPVLKREKSN